MKTFNAITCALVVVAAASVFAPSYAASSNANSGNNSASTTSSMPGACTAKWYDWLLSYVGVDRKGLTCTS